MKKIILFILTALFIGISCILINYFVNPFDVFDRNFSYNSTPSKYQRYTIFPKLKISKNKKYDYAVFGSSNTDTYTDENYFFEKTGQKIYKICFKECFYSEEKTLLKAYIKIHPETKKLLISLDFDALKDNSYLLPEYQNDNLNFSELNFLFFSKQAMVSSYEKIINFFKESYIELIYKLKRKKHIGKIKYVKDYRYCSVAISKNPKTRYEDWHLRKILQSNLDIIDQMKKNVTDNNINGIFYTNPLNSFTLADIYLSDTYDKVENFKRELVKITPFYDFLYVSQYNIEPVSLKNKYWRDPLHAEPELGNLIFQKLITEKGDFGIYVTKDNIEKVLKEEKNILEKFIKNHQEEIKHFRQYKHLDTTPVEQTICL